ncbi:aspartate aminotransferase family protein [Thermodesulfobacteriota bacterium]
MNTEQLIEDSNSLFMNTYARFPAVMVEGSGCRLIDSQGREYLDFLSGIAVCNMGHCYPPVTEAICRQARQLAHVSNVFHTIPQIELARLLVDHSFADRIFLANSGAEANEGAIKLARKHAPEGRYVVISLEGSFHGRTLATVAATGQKKFHQGFAPLPEGFVHAPFGDLKALEECITPTTCAILCEPLQGEGGVRPLDKEYLLGIRHLCDTHELLLIFDEIQVGMGRTGTLFAYEQFGIVPDILTSAKALANGLPLGAVLATDEVAGAFDPGSHASTFGGNPIACAAGVATLQALLAEGFLEKIQAKGAYLRDKLISLVKKYPAVAEDVRGAGLIQGLALTREAIPHGPAIVNRLFQEGVILNFAGNTVLRFVPPLVVTQTEIDTVITKLDPILREYGGGP